MILHNLSIIKRPKTFSRPKGCRPLVIEPVQHGSSIILFLAPIFLEHPLYMIDDKYTKYDIDK